MDSADLTKAQNVLATFEAGLGQDDAMQSLSEGLDYLYEIVISGGQEAVRAQAIGDRYVTVAAKFVKNLLASGSATEPELENARHLMQVLNEYEFGNADDIKHLAFEASSQLFDKIYTGYSEQQKISIIKKELERRERRT